MSDTNFVVHIDGASKGNPGPGASAAVLFADGVRIAEKAIFLEHTTNNEAEYKALIIALDLALVHKCRVILVKTDSELVERQIKGIYKVKNKRLMPLVAKAAEYIRKFEKFDIVAIPREQNSDADRLANETIAARRKSAGAKSSAD